MKFKLVRFQEKYPFKNDSNEIERSNEIDMTLKDCEVEDSFLNMLDDLHNQSGDDLENSMLYVS